MSIGPLPPKPALLTTIAMSYLSERVENLFSYSEIVVIFEKSWIKISTYTFLFENARTYSFAFSSLLAFLATISTLNP